jgi:ABC-type antimicrobial peptide transport system permease subunit
MNTFLFIFRHVFKIRSPNLILGLLNVGIVALLIVITTELITLNMQLLNYILIASAVLLITSVIILCMNSEFAQRTRDISIFRAIGFQKLFLWTFFIIKSLIIGLIGSIIGFIIGNVALIILFNIMPRLMLIIDVLILVTVSALIGCLSSLIKISKLNIPEMLNR